ncbi:hypothetical protein SAY86_003175 [Trapa natans]|uniref:non-specific serine/threonine protein kinase n=1 Tax=Trapa natans TaxID=22666 RepID=A0AAN7LVJ4_TRANT|nr:hypothetical protein SAY86_003175 [Trapa natans]
MVMVLDNEDCGRRRTHEADAPLQSKEDRKKLQVYNEVLGRLKDSGHEEADRPGFDGELWDHFNRLPTRYALDVNVERAEDVLMHKKMLHLVRDPANRPAIQVRLVQILSAFELHSGDPDHSNHPNMDYDESYFSRKSIHPPPAFGSSQNLEALSDDVPVRDEDISVHANALYYRFMHEITFSTDDKPKLLSQLTALLSEIGLNIREAHAFSTVDGYSLAVFVVDGWSYEETEQLKTTIEGEALKIEGHNTVKLRTQSSRNELPKATIESEPDHVSIPTDGTDVWELDPRCLKFGKKVASGSYSDLYKGTYCSQEVAIKVLKAEHVNPNMQREFAQEVFILRKLRHKNVVQFIGACTKSPNLSIVTEFMSGGSIYDYLHKQKAVFKLPFLLKVAIDVSKGMNFLHQNNIIHRDLKTANLLMDENDVVKVADFGVARVKAQTGVMTSETGTYRWMAPEVIQHKPYDHKIDVFSFGIVLWELLTGKIPYEYLTPLQAAVGVAQNEIRPPIPKDTDPKLVSLLERCWQHDPTLRPEFGEIIEILLQVSKEVGANGEERRKEKSSGLLSILRRGHR